MRSRLRLVALAIGLITPALVLATGAQAKGPHQKTLVVSPKGQKKCVDAHGPHFDSIAKAIKHAHEGDTVYVCAGTYA